MAVLDKLLIAGLRSFGPYDDDQQSIKISTPLTLILGENGCGKTTIIEALKFACSGDVPGGSKSGQGFVNDPKLSSMQSVKGQVRLKFSDAQGHKYLAIKSVQVTNKGVTSQFKRLDSTLKKIKPDGTFEDISSRCSDIDSVVCEVLGVSKAILNNVIFCHQENASWPLDEAKKLKEKFDEIFGATEYNKCAETLRKLMKERDSENKNLQAFVSMAKQTKEIVDRKRFELQEKEEKLALMQDTIKEKEESLKVVVKRLQEISDLEDKLGALKERYTQFETKKKASIEQQNTLLDNIPEEFRGTDEELEQEINSFTVNRGKLKQNIDNLKARQQKIEDDRNQLSKQIAANQIKLGKLQSEKNQHHTTLTERNNLIQKACEHMTIKASSSLDADDDVLQTMNEIKKKLEIIKSEYEQLRHDCDTQDTQHQETINASHDKLAKVNHAIQTNMQQKQDMQQKIRDIKSKLRELEYSDEQLKLYENKIAKIDYDLKECKDSFDADSIGKSITNEKQKIRQHEERLEILESQHKVLQQNAIVDAELTTLRNGIRKRELDIDVLKDKHYESFNHIFDEDIPPPGFIKKSVEQHKQNNTIKLNDFNKRITLKQKEATTLDTKCKIETVSLDKLQKELQENEQKVFDLCEGKSYEQVCNDLYQEIEKLQKKKGQYNSARIMYGKFVKEFEKESPCCPICDTGFNNKMELAKKIVTKLKTNIQGIPEKLNEVEEELNSKQQKHAKVLQLQPINSRIEKLNGTLIPQLKSVVTELNDSNASVSDELKDLAQQVITPQGIIDACNKVMGDAALIDQHQLEITRSQTEITKSEQKLVKVQSNKSKQQTEAEIEDLKIDLNNARQHCESSQKKLQQHNERCQELREERNKNVEKQLDLQKNMQGKPQLQEQLLELTQRQDTLETEINELKIQIKPLTRELDEAKANKEKIKRSNNEKLDKARIEINHNQKFIEDINKLQQSIKAYINRNGDGVLKNSLDELDSLKQKEESFKLETNQVIENINNVNKQLASQDGSFRALTDNRTLRVKRKEVEKFDFEIDELKRQIGDYDYRTILAEKLKLREEDSTYKQEIARCNGKTDQLKEELKKIRTDLNTPENKQAYANYKRQLIKFTAAKHVKDNLQVYIKALEIGILKFHEERMAQINKIIKQLWRSIYRGNDCDYIEIKTDEIKSVGARRTYNYKVVQMKNDVEIDMRGRCSAGQKVLACLVIRMALAETFSQNCGILALDEPTTNLDRANIESLSIALARIVNARQVEKNFQLLVITHDEEFLDALTKVEKVSYYWKVTRNERGNSRIQKVFL